MHTKMLENRVGTFTLSCFPGGWRPHWCAHIGVQSLVSPHPELEVQVELCEQGGRRSPQLGVTQHGVVLGQAPSDVLSQELGDLIICMQQSTD